jgi:hypothetical protein
MRPAIVKTLVAAPALAAATLAAPEALACPYCAAQDDGGGWGAWLVLAAMVLFPFAVAAVVVPIVRRAGSEADTVHADPHPGEPSP